ncbi:MAG: recombinase family protein [Schwartzia sp.]|nr:recombinase family protein [Schwartzia sp. (in: firmicutes)]
MNRTALYIRVSTQEQAIEGYSIEAQEDRLTAYCKAKGWVITGVFMDPGFSGSNMERPALQRLFGCIQGGSIDCVLVYKLDRLSRSQKDTLHIIEDIFLKNGVAFVSMLENFDTASPFGRAMIGILSVFAQLEREQIKERTAMGRVERAKSGLWHGGGWKPFGYDYTDGRLVVNPVEAVVVREVYDEFLSGTAIHHIVTALSKKYGRPLNPTLIRSILSTPLYVGRIQWEGRQYQGQHDPIIDQEAFSRAGLLLADRSRISASKEPPFRQHHLLTGLLYCGNCGAMYTTKGNYSGHGTNRRYYPYYYCYSRAKTNKRRVIDPLCMSPAFPVEKIDRRITGEIKAMTSASNRVLTDLSEAARHEPEMARRDEERQAIQRRLDEIDHQIPRIIDLYQIGTISLDDISTRTQKLQNERETLQTTLTNLAAPLSKPRLTLAEARANIKDFATVRVPDTQRKILHSLIQKITVHASGRLEIAWNF